jgi:hypothetical protein
MQPSPDGMRLRTASNAGRRRRTGGSTWQLSSTRPTRPRFGLTGSMWWKNCPALSWRSRSTSRLSFEATLTTLPNSLNSCVHRWIPVSSPRTSKPLAALFRGGFVAKFLEKRFVSLHSCEYRLIFSSIPIQTLSFFFKSIHLASFPNQVRIISDQMRSNSNHFHSNGRAPAINPHTRFQPEAEPQGI